ncbi:hypothetical protein ACFOET_18030 [Parapedobacter deserti]|uniref:Uncharacterized protein n=1 Tax=Parapedobacter deserti TaxID=1912957 RepID=A0ABV7JTS6_9SPHI
MRRKIFSIIALVAFAATTGFSMVKTNLQDDTIWVYLTGPAGATQTPDCDAEFQENCAQLYEWDGTNIGEPVKDENNENIYLQGRRIL